MDTLRLERWLTGLIAGITILTGVIQLLWPGRLLPLLGVEVSAATAQLFGTVGVFMMLFGGAVLHAQARSEALPVVLLWAALQKIAASLLVGCGVLRGVFAPLALLVAGFDLASGLLFLDLRRRGG
jgi:hypothetical protein